MRILNTTFETVPLENGKKKLNIDGPLAGAVLLLPFGITGLLGFIIGRFTS